MLEHANVGFSMFHLFQSRLSKISHFLPDSGHVGGDAAKSLAPAMPGIGRIGSS